MNPEMNRAGAPQKNVEDMTPVELCEALAGALRMAEIPDGVPGIDPGAHWYRAFLLHNTLRRRMEARRDSFLRKRDELNKKLGY
jgi:hypothetical protein